MCKKLVSLIICIFIPLAVGSLSAFLTKDAMSSYGHFRCIASIHNP